MTLPVATTRSGVQSGTRELLAPFIYCHLRAGLRCKERSMGSFTAPTTRHTGCRDLRPVELEYLRSIVRKSGDDALQGILTGVLLSSVFWLSLACLFF